MVRTLEGGALSALTGGLAGGVLGGILGLFTRVRLGSGSLHSDATVPWQEIHPSIRDETLALQRRLNSELGIQEMAVNQPYQIRERLSSQQLVALSELNGAEFSMTILDDGAV